MVVVMTTGTVPAPRQWLSWHLGKLEPAGIKTREDMMNNTKNSKKSQSASRNE